MIEASKKAELSSKPTKRAWKAWLIALAVVVAVTTIALLTNAPRKEPVKVSLIRAAGAPGHKVLILEATNGTARPIQLTIGVCTGATHPAKTGGGRPMAHNGMSVEVAGRTTSLYSLLQPPKDTPYYVAWEFRPVWTPATRWERCRMACLKFFLAHGMPAPAEHFAPARHVGHISSTDIKE